MSALWPQRVCGMQHGAYSLLGTLRLTQYPTQFVHWSVFRS